MKDQLNSLLATPIVMSVREFDGLVRQEGERYEKVIKQHGLKY